MQTELLSLSKIFTENLFRIPDYQRGYSWTDKQLKDFWSDLMLLDSGRNHYTGVLTLEEVPQKDCERWSDDYWIIVSKHFSPHYVVDGQQRLTTSIILIQAILEQVSPGQELNYSTVDEIRKKFVYESRDKGVSRSYVFGYEKDNPSYEFLKTSIFMEPSDNHSTGEETIYTQNLAAAKSFFKEQLKDLTHEQLEAVYTKLTQHFLFNIYTIAGDVDVFVAFETMNNRGKPLSHLELLKNRLIFLSTRLDVDGVERAKLRLVINESWKAAYHYLGRNKTRPLNDDYFLYTHFVLYFGAEIRKKHSDEMRVFVRMRREDYYKRFLLDEVFTSRNLQPVAGPSDRKLTTGGIYEYAHDLKRRVQMFYKIHNPDDSAFSGEVKVALARLNRLEWGAALPLALIACDLSKKGSEFADLLHKLERYIFVQYMRRYRSLEEFDLNELAIGIKVGAESVASAAAKIHAYTDRYASKIEHPTGFADADARRGYYGWKYLRYFLFEYEQSLKAQSRSNRDKVSWDDFASEDYEEDYFTVEHVYPQKPKNEYWTVRFKSLTSRQRAALRNSLGNLVALSRPKNSALGNRSFTEKRDGKDDLPGYRVGSYSEIEVARAKEWTPKAILERGLRMLSFLEKRWGINLGDRASKARVLGLEFLLKDGS